MLSNRVTKAFFGKLILSMFFFNVLMFWERLVNNILVQEKYYSFNKSVKYVLIWNDNFQQLDNILQEGILDSCSSRNCLATFNIDMVPTVQDFDAIIFHIPGNGIFLRSPSVRSAKQKYIFFDSEPPTLYGYIWNSYNFYNWTMTYRKDSDIHYPYNMIVKVNTNYSRLSVEQVQQKKKLVAWFVSNCQAQRMKYVRKLQKYIPVDIYGKCGTPCENRTACYEMLDKHYKFYLSFENSLCTDYVTEKLFNILKLNVIPVVLGSANYSEVAPPHSVIQVKDFSSPDDLSKYLLYLHFHPKEYLSYFKWKSHYIVPTSREQMSMVLCQICQKLNEPIQYFSYKNMYAWHRGPNNSICQYNLPS